MGAAKNARKARRKARRSEDRRPYYFDIETAQGIAPWDPIRDISRDIAGGTTLHALYDPINKEKKIVGETILLTQEELRRLIKEGTKPSKKPNSWLEHIRPKGDSFGGLFDRSIFDRINRFTPDFQHFPRHGRMSSGQLATMTNNIVVKDTLSNIDYSKLEEMIMETLDKKALYAAMYGATEHTVRDLYLQQFPAGFMGDPLSRTYRGHKIGDIVQSHPLNKGESDAEDDQKVEGVSGYSARIVRIDGP
jgi:hypothetical protein